MYISFPFIVKSSCLTLVLNWLGPSIVHPAFIKATMHLFEEGFCGFLLVWHVGSWVIGYWCIYDSADQCMFSIDIAREYRLQTFANSH